MTPKRYAIVGRMQGLRPEQLARYEMHRLRCGGDLGHCDPARRDLNRLLIGQADWAAATLARIDEIRFSNHNRKMASLEQRKRRKDVMEAIAEGPTDPWRPTKVGPMRELILTANKDFFQDKLAELFGEDFSPAQKFEALAVDWLKTTFGDAVIHARADHDEAAYHIHAVLMPVMKKKDGRAMLEPSSHPLIKDYEKLQDELGNAFASVGLVRGERRAEAIREALAAQREGKLVEVPTRRQHLPTRKWREQQTRDLADRQEAINAQQIRQAEREKEAAAELARQRAVTRIAQEGIDAAHERQREQQVKLDQQEAEQRAFAAGAALIAQGIMTPEDEPEAIVDRSAPEQLAASVRAAPAGWRRLATALRPAWGRIQQAARQEAETGVIRERNEIMRDRQEIDHVWTQLAEMTRRISPSLFAAESAPREIVRKAIAKWRMLTAREKDQLLDRGEGR